MYNKDNLLMIIGGASSFNGTLINSISRLFDTLLEVGRSLGSAIRRMVDGTKC
ncbi:MAG: hypothetical protein IJB82_03250 [Bacilli bacterium]|nr:hypothetical protein [Bacilli bacterium]